MRKDNQKSISSSGTEAPTYRRGAASIISTILITSILIIILVVASFVAMNILNAEMAATEFDQAKSNMQLLDDMIQDVSLRPGAGGYVQFNEREGGVGIYDTADTLSLYIGGSSYLNYNNLVQLVYAGGPLASVAVDQAKGYSPLDGDLSFAYVNSTETVGFLRLEQDDGAKIKLDFMRFRIIPMGLIDSQTGLVQVTLIKLVRGSSSGSGTVRVQVQNAATNQTVFQLATGNLTFNVQHTSSETTITQTFAVQITGAIKTAVIFSEVQVKISIS